MPLDQLAEQDPLILMRVRKLVLAGVWTEHLPARIQAPDEQ